MITCKYCGRTKPEPLQFCNFCREVNTTFDDMKSTVTWHKYPDEMPQDYEYCLVYAKRTGTGEPCPISIARCFKGVWEMLNYQECNAVSCGDISDHMVGSEVTNWAYLPSLPKD